MTSDTGDGHSRREVLQLLSLGGLSIATGLPESSVGAEAAAPPALAPAGSGFNPRRWWAQEYRIVQTNLREIDAREKPRDIARAVREFGGNVIVSNIGGIVAFYPTQLEYQRRNPYLEGDFVAGMIEAAHAEGLAYIGRFDLSKAMQPVYEAHPDWFMLDRSGKPREYEGTYQACPNGGWAQDYGLRILDEALQRYKPDGVFFNMTGYPLTDYSNVNHGICVCANCQRVFRDMFGRELPKIDNFSDPAWLDYLEFRERTTAALADKVQQFAAPLLAGAPITRFDGYAVVGRGEVQRRVDRPAPEWAYQAGEQCRTALARNPGKPWSSTSTAHIDYPWRQVTETAAYHELRFAQMLGVGAHLDLYLMGTLADQDDQSYLPPLSQLYKWRSANAVHYAGMSQSARVALYHSQSTERLAGLTPYASHRAASFRGAYSALVDSRVPFRFVSDKQVADGSSRLSEEFDVIVAPDVMMMSETEAAALDRFVAAGGLLIAMGLTAGYDNRGDAFASVPLACFPLERYGTASAARGWSLDAAKGDLRLTGRVPIDGHYFGGSLRAGSMNLLPFAPDQRFGPPEFCYAIPGVPARTLPGLPTMALGKGRAVHIPWSIGWQYYRDGLPVHQQLIAALLERYSAAPSYKLRGDGPVELMVMRNGVSGALLLHVVNYAGQRNGRYELPPALHGLSVGVKGSTARQARALVSGRSLTAVRLTGDPDYAWFELPPLGTFEALLIAA